MKILLLTSMMLLGSQAFAFDPCVYQETSELNLTTLKLSKNPRRFTFAEKSMIHRTVALQRFHEGVSRGEALETFSEAESDGRIAYYEFEEMKLIFVQYWPDDNEYGAFYKVRPYGGVTLIAIVEDGLISCIEE
jgi:hypothetical protein